MQQGALLEEAKFLLNMTLLLLVAGICSVVFKRLKMPPIIGYLVAGIILANFWLGDDPETMDIVSILSSMGLVTLMFCIGMELNLKKLKKVGAFAIMVSLIQMPIMVFGGYMFGLFLGWGAIQSILFGAIISGSSTAVVTAVLKDQGRLSKEDVDTIILVTVVEDVAQVIILSLASPLLIGSAMELDSMVWMMIIIVTFMVAAVVIGILVVPRSLDWIASKMPDEVLLVTSLGMCFAMALMSVWIGMSMAIGAFLMGVVVSQAASKNRIEHDITPMKDIFMAMFFISVGLAIVPSGILDNIFLIILIFGIYTILKTGSVFIAYFIGNKPMRIGFMSSVSLVAMGEFAFIIAKAGLDAGVLSDSFYTSVITAAIVSMIALPLLSHNSGKICDYTNNHAPKSIINAAKKIENVRDDHYAKIALSSKSTRARFREKAAFAYAYVLLLFIIELMFFLFSTDMAEFINRNSQNAIPIDTCHIIILIVNFVAVAILLYKILGNLKFIGKVLLDAQRKAGVVNIDKMSTKIQKTFIKMNTWVLAFIITFTIIFLVPTGAGFLGDVEAMLGGAAIILIIYAYRQRTGPSKKKRDLK